LKDQKNKVFLFCNGELKDPSRIKQMDKEQAYLVGVDGGTHHLRRLGWQADLVIGDLDSISPVLLTELKDTGVEIVRFPVDKDQTDLELAIERVVAMGFRDISIMAALGGRLDQTLGNLFLLTSPMLSDCRVRLVDGMEEVVVIRNSEHLQGKKGDIVSLIPVVGAAYGVSTEGLRFPLTGETLYMEQSRGISNEMVEENALVRVEEGFLLCIHTLSSGEKTSGGDV
jgi:thiamine pyrophosphokinase